MLQCFDQDDFQHPPYSPHLMPSDFYQFPMLKEFLGCRHFQEDDKLKEIVTEWFKNLVAGVYNEGIEKNGSTMTSV